MAATGSGTQADPLIVHNYSELSTWHTKKPTNEIIYVKLANDIDCNDYGDSWEWGGILISLQRSTDNVYLDLDLCGHTIKNILVSKSASIFFDDGHVKNQDKSKIHDGKILNVFFNGSSCGFRYVTLDNLSISMNGNNLVYEAFYYCPMNRCSVYFVRNTEYNQVFCYEYNNNIRNCDFYIEIPNLTKHLFYADAYGLTRLYNCRFRGKIAFNGYSFGAPISCNISNCVVDMYVTDTGLAWASFAYSGTGVINSSKLDHVGVGGLTPVTDEQLHSAASLNAKGFNVVKVGG